ncbi:MAG: YdeI/OmpD-associated family protein [Burkholderiales bacterium]|nr:YdeI/OmpD-associated family protein [Flavobacterium sp.]
MGKKNGSKESFDSIKSLIISEDLHVAFKKNVAFLYYKQFIRSYRKSNLYWLNQAKRDEIRKLRIASTIKFCAQNIKPRP